MIAMSFYILLLNMETLIVAFALTRILKVTSTYKLCMHFSHVDFLLIGEHHQYDTVVYPKVVKVAKSFVGKMIARIGAFVGLGSSAQTENAKEVEVKIPPKEELAAQCLQFYLEPYKSVLLQDGEHPKEYNVDSLVTEIINIYSQLHEPWVDGHKRRVPLFVKVSTIEYTGPLIVV